MPKDLLLIALFGERFSYTIVRNVAMFENKTSIIEQKNSCLA